MQFVRAIWFGIVACLAALSCSSADRQETLPARPEYACVLPEGLAVSARQFKADTFTDEDQDVLVALWEQIVVTRQLYEENRVGTAKEVLVTLATSEKGRVTPDSTFVARIDSDSLRILTTPRDAWNGVWVELRLRGWAGPDTAVVESSVLRGVKIPSGMSLEGIAVRDSAGWRVCRYEYGVSVN